MKKPKLFSKNSFLDEQIDIVEAKIRTTKFGTIEYGRWLDIRDKLVKQKKNEKVDIPVKDIADIVLRCAEIGLNVGLVIYGYKLYANIAALSYGLDEGMTLCNGRVSNFKELVMKLVPKKV